MSESLNEDASLLGISSPEEDDPKNETVAKGKAKVSEMIEAIERGGQESILDDKREITIRGFTVRPVRLGSIEMLRILKSPLIAGVAIDNPANLLGDALEFLYLHVVSEEEAIEHCFLDEKERKKAILRWSNKVEMGDVKDIVSSSIRLLVQATSTQVKAEPPEHLKSDKKKEPSSGKE